MRLNLFHLRRDDLHSLITCLNNKLVILKCWRIDYEKTSTIKETLIVAVSLSTSTGPGAGDNLSDNG